MSPDTISSQCCAREMQLCAAENLTESIQHDINRLKQMQSMFPQSNIQMCNEDRRLISRQQKHRYQNKSIISYSRNEIVNANNNINYKQKEQLNNDHNNVLEWKDDTVITNRKKQLISDGDCVLKNNYTKSTIDRLQSNEQFSLMNPINKNNRKQKNPLNYINYTYRRGGGLNILWQVAVIIFICLICTSTSEQCVSGLKTPGRTLPAGDIVLEYGQPLRILCMLNKTYVDEKFPSKNASDLVFFRNNKEIEPEFIRILNETTSEMFVDKPPPSKDMYYCKLRLDRSYDKEYEVVCLNDVVVGFQPQMPQNFSCISHNWEDMMCSWDPIDNYVETRVTLTFKLPGRTGGRKIYPCPKNNSQPVKPNSCLWEISTDPIYRQPYEYYIFILNAENVLGNISFPFRFHHWAHVIPAKPANLSIVNKTTESVLLHWSVPFPMRNFPGGLHHRIAFQHQWDTEKIWQVINITNDIRVYKRFYNLTGIIYANTVYDVRVFMKSALATGEDKWSNFSDITFRSPPRLPGLAARTDVGSFEIIENKINRDVYLYWRAIPLHLENGDNFKYQISYIEENGTEIFITPNETTRTYAKFKNISFNSYRFDILTTNTIGAHPEKASIFIPSRSETPDEPSSFTKIAFKEGIYELSWNAPMRHEMITNYTIFWCDNDRDRRYQCTGPLDWVHVSKTAKVHNMSVPDARKAYEFAISANAPNGSSGMVWASCTVNYNEVIGKMKSVWINQRGSTNISVSWNLDCSDRIGNVEGFNIYYCPIAKPRNSKCKGPKQNTTISAGPLTTSGVVTGLKPYTTYMISVAVLTKNGEGIHSNYLYDTTFEAAPGTPPQNVTVGAVTNSTMFVMWEPPTAINGVLRYYTVSYSGNSVKVDNFPNKTYVLLRDLLAFKNYSISVIACTVECSPPSPVVYHLTAIGKPGKILKTPTVRFVNSTHMTIMWNKPFNSGGNLDYYQISSGDDQISSGTDQIHNSTKMEIQLPIPDCQGDGRRRVYYFRVRAVNIDQNGHHIPGLWSDPGENNCYSDGSSFRVYVIIWIISCMSLFILLFCILYTSKRMWLKCKAMQDVEVKLPPGLATHEKLLQRGSNEQHMRQSSADSSHCSSGQESVTSSLTSGSHGSADSGTEVDPVTISQNKLIESSNTWETSSLRQRIVGTTRPGLTDSLKWDSCVKSNKPGEGVVDDAMLLVRSTPSLTDSSGFMMPQQAWSSTGYISMPSSEELSSNPSPIPSETERTGSYSVVGMIPNVTHSKADKPTDSLTNTLLTCKDDVKPSVPYVSLASLEQKLQDKPIDSLHDLNLKFPSPDQSSKPYVQTGLMDNMRKSIGVNSPAELSKKDSLQSQFLPTLDSSNTLGYMPELVVNPSPLKSVLSDTTSKPYVTVGSIPEKVMPTKLAARLTDDKQKNQSTPLEIAHKPYVQASTVFQMLQHQKNKSDDTLCVEKNDMDQSSSKPSSIHWQSDNVETNALPELDKSIVASKLKNPPEYTMSTETPKNQDIIPVKKMLPYVQHQRLEKQMSPAGTSTTDEQYSKVAVAPHTAKMP